MGVGSFLDSVVGVAIDGANRTADGFNNAKDAVRDAVFGDDDPPDPVVPSPDDIAEAELAEVAALDGAGGSLGPVVRPEVFEAMEHDAIYLGAQQLAPEQVEAGARLWTSAHAALVPLVDRLWAEIGAVLGVDWQGGTADHALGDVTRYRDQSLSMVALLNFVSTKLTESHAGLEATRVAVPPPVHWDTGSLVMLGVKTFLTGPSGGFLALASHREEETRRRAEAVAAMNAIYIPTIVGADSGVPTLPPPFDPTNTTATGPLATAAATVGGATGAGNGGSGGYDAVSPAGTVAASTGAAGPQASVTPDRAGTTAPAGSPSASAGSMPGSSGSTPGSAGGLGYGAAPTTAAGYGGTRAGGAGGAGGSGSRAAGSGGGGTPGSPRGAYGPGSASSPVGGILQSGSGAAGSGGRGMAYGPGAMMPGGRGAGDHDTEHTSAGYLVTADNGDELVGELPLVAPPVIG